MFNTQSTPDLKSRAISVDPNETLADFDLDTIITLSGIPDQKEIINPRKPSEMAKRVRITFRPLPRSYDNRDVVDFRDKLKEKLVSNGVEVVPWKEAAESVSGSLIAKVLRSKKVSSSIDAVIDVKREYSFFRKILSKLAEKIYELFLRSSDRSVMEILKVSGWADDFTARYVQDPFNTQIITLVALDPEFADSDTSYDRKISIGLKNLIATMSEIVIGVAKERFSIINMNLSDSIFPSEELDNFILNSLIPKIYAPIKPPVLTRFERGTYDPAESDYALKLAELGKRLRTTDLFPHGSKFSEKVERLSHRDVVEKLLEGRTGVSYGFIAIVESPRYHGPEEITAEEWYSLYQIEGKKSEVLRQNISGRWYVRTIIGEKVKYQQVPDIWIVTSRSGCDKTDLDPERDVVRIGLISGKLHLQVPEGVDLERRDIRPSFDTYVIISQALATTLYASDLIEDGAPIIHFHGYPDPKWFGEGEYHTGASNPSMPCGTIEAALLNYSGIYELASKNGNNMKLLCLVESDHGVNILGVGRDYVLRRLAEGCSEGKIQLGGKYLPHLKRDSSI